jgi:hypothetical protein
LEVEVEAKNLEEGRAPDGGGKRSTVKKEADMIRAEASVNSNSAQARENRVTLSRLATSPNTACSVHVACTANARPCRLR